MDRACSSSSSTSPTCVNVATLGDAPNSLLQRRGKKVGGLQLQPLRRKVSLPVVSCCSRELKKSASTICDEVEGAYSNIERIGEGGFGVVYKAVCRSDEREVALKVVRTCDSEVVQICRAEFKLMQRIDHPNIARALDFMMTETRCILVMSYFDGEELGQAVQRTESRRLSEMVSCRLFQALLEALDHLHSQQIVHRDMKPENVLVSNDWNRLQLIDFNVSCYLSECDLHSPCSPAYAAPEFFSDCSPSEAADIWGAGLCLLMMLTGECIADQGKVKFGSLDWSAACEKVLKSCLAQDMGKRPSAASLLNSDWIEGFRSSTVGTPDAQSCVTSLSSPETDAKVKPPHQQTSASTTHKVEESGKARSGSEAKDEDSLLWVDFTSDADTSFISASCNLGDFQSDGSGFDVDFENNKEALALQAAEAMAEGRHRADTAESS